MPQQPSSSTEADDPQDREKRLLELIEGLDEAMYRMSLIDGRYEYMSKSVEKVMGYTQDECLHNPALVQQVIHPDSVAYLQEKWGEMMAGNISPTYEYKIIDPAGQERWLIQSNQPVYDESGRMVAMEGLIRNITQYRQVEVELQKHRTRLEELAEERAARLRLQQELIDAQQRAIHELSTPIIPVTDHIVVVPLVGTIDSMRARDITRTLLHGIHEHRAKVVILDITGVPLVDSGVAGHLSKTIQAARLKGARTIVTGVSDAVAETIVDLGIDWRGVETLNNLQTGLMAALAGLGIKMSKA